MNTSPNQICARRRPLFAATVLALLLAGCGGGADDPGVSNAGGNTGASTAGNATGAASAAGVNNVPDAFAANALAAINAFRAQPRNCGSQLYPAVPALAWHSMLATIAIEHSQDMKRGNFFDHQGSDGSDVGTRATAAGYPWLSIGENIAVGQQTVEEVVADWAASEGHCVNIMSANAREMAVAVVLGDGNNSFSHYWTMVLGHR